MTKRNIIIIVLFAGVLGYYYLIADQSTQEVAPDAEIETMLSEIRKDTKVKEAIVTSASVLYVAIRPDGSDADEYAAEVCSQVSKLTTKISTVKVVKFGSTSSEKRDNAYGILLGQSSCR